MSVCFVKAALLELTTWRNATDSPRLFLAYIWDLRIFPKFHGVENEKNGVAAEGSSQTMPKHIKTPPAMWCSAVAFLRSQQWQAAIKCWFTSAVNLLNITVKRIRKNKKAKSKVTNYSFVLSFLRLPSGCYSAPLFCSLACGSEPLKVSSLAGVQQTSWRCFSKRWLGGFRKTVVPSSSDPQPLTCHRHSTWHIMHIIWKKEDRTSLLRKLKTLTWQMGEIWDLAESLKPWVVVLLELMTGKTATDSPRRFSAQQTQSGQDQNISEHQWHIPKLGIMSLDAFCAFQIHLQLLRTWFVWKWAISFNPARSCIWNIPPFSEAPHVNIQYLTNLKSAKLGYPAAILQSFLEAMAALFRWSTYLKRVVSMANY